MEFVEIVISYPQFCVYEEYKGKPYFSIKYTENGQEFIGFGTYKLEVLSEYLRSYFMTPQIVPCEDCISREEAINVVHYYFQHYLDVNDDICLDGIRTLPSVQPNRQKMCWKDRKSFLERWECPCCGHTENCKENFCKICGADMRGEDDDE